MPSWWVVDDNGSYGVIEALDFKKADTKMFLGICRNIYPMGVQLIEMMPDEDVELTEADFILEDEITENDIISSE